MHLDLTNFWDWGQVTIEDYLKMNYGWILSFVIQVHRMFFHLFRSKYFVLFNTIIAGIISLIKFLVMQLTFVSWSCFFQPCWTCLLVVIVFFSKFLWVFYIQDFLFLCFYSYYISRDDFIKILCVYIQIRSLITETFCIITLPSHLPYIIFLE